MKEEGKERRKERRKGSERKKGRRCDTGKNWTRKYVVLNVTA